jgi:AraC-like DNA-binding protein
MGHVDLAGTWHEASFRLVESYDVQMERRWRIALDPQPYGELVQVTAGQCRFQLGDDVAVLGPGDLGILLPGPPRVTEDVGVDPLRLRGFGFRIELFAAIELSGLLGLPLALSDPDGRVEELLVATVANGALGGAAAALRARSFAEQAIAELVAAVGEVGTVTGRRRPEIEAALSLMARELSGDLDIAVLAKAAHLSPKHFSRTFKDVVGVPPMTYLQAMRLSRARSALASTDVPAGRIATDHGFADAAHFSRAFKRRYGVTPTEFRARSPRGSRSTRSSGSRPGDAEPRVPAAAS